LDYQPPDQPHQFIRLIGYYYYFLFPPNPRLRTFTNKGCLITELCDHSALSNFVIVSYFLLLRHFLTKPYNILSTYSVNYIHANATSSSGRCIQCITSSTAHSLNMNNSFIHSSSFHDWNSFRNCVSMIAKLLCCHEFNWIICFIIYLLLSAFAYSSH